MGFTVANGSTIQAKSVAGEALSGFARSASFAIGSGFVADSVVQSHLTGVENAPTTLPSVYALKQHYPNPFNPRRPRGFKRPAASIFAEFRPNRLMTGQDLSTPKSSSC